MKDSSEQTVRVSVVMCTYNGAAYLREQMDSILAQDYPLHEIIVQDDRSTDDTPVLLADYAARESRIRVFRNTERLGFNRNFHTALLRATGDFIAIADQDDIWFPQKIRRQVEEIGDRDVCFSEYFTDAEYREPLHVRVCPNNRLEHLLFYDCTPGHTMLVRRDFVRTIRHWDYYIYYDWWLSLHAHLGRGIHLVREPLNWHRHHTASATTHIYRKGRYEAVMHPTWQPYVLGFLHRRHLQRKGNWQRFYRYIAAQTESGPHATAHRIAVRMYRRDLPALVSLCLLCARNVNLVYPRPQSGWKGKIRGFFYPLISAYGNDLFKLEK